MISDIDDTIKISQVTQKRELLRNTFLRPFRAVVGMPALYQAWADQGAEFHLVSSSPWQLYEPLSGFVRAEAFPPATFHLRRIRLKDPTTLISFGAPQELKVQTISALLQRFPARRFVLVGDSGEQDPEAYGQVARQFPDQVAAIFIREVAAERPRGWGAS